MCAVLSCCANAAYAACYSYSGNSSLEEACYRVVSLYRPFSLQEIERINRLFLSQHRGEATHVESNDFWDYSVAPILYFDSNINGGNPDRPLVLNGLVFQGNESLYAKSGWMGGISAGVSYLSSSGRAYWNTASLNTAQAHSFTHPLSTQSYSANLCHNRRFTENLYGNGCVSSQYIRREISRDRTNDATLSMGYLIVSPQNRQAALEFTVGRQSTDDYFQNSLSLSYEMLAFEMPLLWLKASSYEAVFNTHAKEWEASLAWRMPVAHRFIDVTISRSQFGGSRLLGVMRTDEINAISVSSHINGVGSLRLGFENRNSSIDYFDARNAVVSLGLSSLF